MLRENPILKLFIPLITGILLSIYFSRIRFSPILCGIIFLIAAIYLLFFYIRLSYKNQWIYGLMIHILMFLSGVSVVSLRELSFKHEHFSSDKTSEYFQAIIEDYPQAKAKSYKVIVKIYGLYDSARWKPVSGKIMTYLEKTPEAGELKPGTRILFKGNYFEIANSGNPGAFYYKSYLARRGIYHQLYLSQNDWKVIGDAHAFSIKTLSAKARMQLLKMMKNSGVSGDEYSVAAAILLGNSDYLDQELRQKYSGSGTMHILAVSGLHVGIIYLILFYLLGFLSKIPHGRLIRSIIVVFAIWIYALITGLSPSVTRAATMFSFVSMGEIFKRRTPIFNTLAASACFILIFNPFLIQEIGFQLSYLAVLGIVVTQPGIYRMLNFKNKIADKIWGLICVSIASQIATFPLALFYFHQFPVYFIISNLLVIPISYVIMMLGVAFFMILPFGHAGFYAGKVLSGSIWLMNQSVGWVESLPGAVASGIYITAAQYLVLYFVIIMLILFFSKNIKSYFQAALAGIFLFFFIDTADRLYRSRQQSMYVMNSPRIKGPWLVNGIDGLLFTSPSEGYSESQQIQQSLKIKNIQILSESNLLRWNGKLIYYIPDGTTYADQSPVKPDYCIISGNPAFHVQEFLSHIHPQMIIMDGSVPRWICTEWEKTLKELDVSYHAVPLDGVLRIDLSE